MSKLYGTVGGDGRAREQNRCAHRETFAAARSWEGSVTAEIIVTDRDTHYAAIRVTDGSGCGGRTLWYGKLADLLAAESLALK